MLDMMYVKWKGVKFHQGLKKNFLMEEITQELRSYSIASTNRMGQARIIVRPGKENGKNN